MNRVVIESPFAGNILTRYRNRIYARRCLHDSLVQGEAPIASHILYTLVLNDCVPEERQIGIAAGHAWINFADLLAVYIDYGISRGMEAGMRVAKIYGIPIEYRWLFSRAPRTLLLRLGATGLPECGRRLHEPPRSTTGHGLSSF